MVIPIRCVSCNNVLAGKWLPYTKKVEEYKKKEGRGSDMEYLTQTTVKTAEGRALDDVGISKMCCRRHMLTHVDLM